MRRAGMLYEAGDVLSARRIAAQRLRAAEASSAEPVPPEEVAQAKALLRRTAVPGLAYAMAGFALLSMAGLCAAAMVRNAGP